MGRNLVYDRKAKGYGQWPYSNVPLILTELSVCTFQNGHHFLHFLSEKERIKYDLSVPEVVLESV